jgi:hypothetical protein
MTHCHDCNRPRFPEGGVQMTPKRWICAKCWGLFLQGRQPAKEAA